MATLLDVAKFSDVTRHTLDLTPYSNSSLSNTGNTIVKFRLPQENILLGKDLVLNFNCEIDGDAASDDKLVANICSVWNSLRVRVAGSEVQHVREYGHIQSLDDAMKQPYSFRTSFGAIAQGIPALASSGTAVRYGMRFLQGTFLANVIPTYKIGQLEIEFELETQLGKIASATTAPTELDITEMQLRCPFIKSEQLKQHFDSNDVVVKFTDYENHRDTSLLAAATSHTTTLPTNHKSLDGVVVQMRKQTDVQNPALVAEKYTNISLTNALTKFSFVLDGQQVPRREINCKDFVEPYEYLLEYAGHKKGEEFNAGSFFDGTYGDATSSQFIIAFPFNGLTGAKNTISGINTSGSSNQLQIHFSSMTASDNTQIDVFLRYSRSCKFTKNGEVIVTK